MIRRIFFLIVAAGLVVSAAGCQPPRLRKADPDNRQYLSGKTQCPVSIDGRVSQKQPENL